MKKELGQSELPVSRKDPKTTRKCYSGRLSNFEQFLGLFSKLVALIDRVPQCPNARIGALGSLDEHNAHYATVVTDAQSS